MTIVTTLVIPETGMTMAGEWDHKMFILRCSDQDFGFSFCCDSTVRYCKTEHVASYLRCTQTRFSFVNGPLQSLCSASCLEFFCLTFSFSPSTCMIVYCINITSRWRSLVLHVCPVPKSFCVCFPTLPPLVECGSSLVWVWIFAALVCGIVASLCFCWEGGEGGCFLFCLLWILQFPPILHWSVSQSINNLKINVISAVPSMSCLFTPHGGAVLHMTFT